MSTDRARNFLFTINNPSIFDEHALSEIRFRCKFLQYQLERGEDGTEHYQGLICFKNPHTFQALKFLLPRAHIEHVRKLAAAYEYTRKAETRIAPTVSYGDPPSSCLPNRRRKRGPGADLQDLRSLLDRGAKRSFIARNFFNLFLRYDRGISSYISITSPKRTFKTIVTVLYGKPGTGKTTKVLRMCSALEELGRSVYWKPSGDWFDSYEGQSVVVFDDFMSQDMRYSTFKNVCDRIPLLVPVKGNFVNWAPRIIFITTNQDPHSWYVNEREYFLEIARRVDLCYYFEETAKWTEVDLSQDIN